MAIHKTSADILFLLGYPRLTCQSRLAGIYRSAAEKRLRVHVIENAYSRNDFAEVLSFWRPAGLIVSCGYGTGGFDFSPLGRLPIVYYDNDPLPGGSSRWASVRSDSRQIGEWAARELCGLKYPNFAYVPHRGDFHWSRQRGEAFRVTVESLVGASIAFFPTAELSSPTARLLALKDWLASLPRPCGVFAANDLVAEEVEIAAERAGLRVPRDLALVGVDNQEQLCSNLPVPLTSIQMDFEQGGYLAADRLSAMIDGRRIDSPDCLYPALKIDRRMSTRVTPTPAVAFADRLTAYIREHVEAGVTVDQLVRESGYSRRQAESLFRSGTGKSLLTAINDAVYDRACVLVKRPNMTLAAVSDSLGGISRSRLDRIFEAHTGLSASAWLRRKG